jgi:hypothetical protein
MGRLLLGLALIAALVGANGARADDEGKPSGDPFYRLDTKNLFGALEGADVGEAGDRSIELETTASLFKPAGRYVFVEQEAIYEMTATPRLGIEFGSHGLGQSIRGVAGIDNYAGVDFSGLSNEWRYVLTPRAGAWSVQTTVTATPQWERAFEGGAHGEDLALPLLLIVDAQPIARRLYAALNVSYAPEVQRLGGSHWTKSSSLNASAALSWRFTPAAMIGGEADLFNQFDGLAAQSWRDSALFVGPTFHYQISEKIDLSGAWTQQLAGRARGEDGALNFADFTRSQAKLRLEIEF